MLSSELAHRKLLNLNLNLLNSCYGVVWMKAKRRMKMPLPEPSQVYGVFYGQLNESSVQRLFSGLINVAQNTKHVHLLLQSSGGRPSDGICLYNFLKRYPIDLSIYNSGSVQSIATIAFLGSKIRIVDRHATFMVHRVFWLTPHAIPVEEITTAMQSMKLENERIESILRKHIKFSHTAFSNLGSKELWYSAKDAVRIGLADKIGTFSPPRGSRIHNFGF